MDGFTHGPSGIPRIGKDTGARLPYTLDWYEWLRGDDLYFGEYRGAEKFYHALDTLTPSRGKLNGHRYRADNAGIVGDEPVWPTGSGATVVSGSVTFREIGAEDTLQSVVHTPPAQLTKHSESNTATTSTVELSGGSAAGTVHRVACRATSVGGKIDDRSFDIVMRER